MTDLEHRLRALLEEAVEASAVEPPIEELVRRGQQHRRAQVSALIATVAVVTAAVVVAALLLPGTSTSTPRPLSSTPTVDNSPRARAQAEVTRLLRQATLPRGAVALASAPSPSATTTGRVTPAVDTVVTASRYWRLNMAAADALAWLREHPPLALTQATSSTGGIDGNPAYGMVGYSEPPPAGLDDPQLQETVMPIDGHTSILRIDATVIWLDPRPLGDTAAGPRLRVRVTSGCPTSDAHAVGVTNPGTGLDRSLLPDEVPVSGLVCTYVGTNGNANSLLRQTALGATASRRLAAFINTIGLAHTDGGFTSCAMDDGAFTVLVFAYRGHADVDLWWSRGGCQPLGNGHIVSTGAARAGLSGAVDRSVGG